MVFGLLKSLFKGKVVAKIPFVRIRLLQKMSHKGLTGNDMTDCSIAFLYSLCSISISTNLVFGILAATWNCWCWIIPYARSQV
ncbi:hypothetical protein ABFS83_11G085400 [Erythranthe nasuta]